MNSSLRLSHWAPLVVAIPLLLLTPSQGLAVAVILSISHFAASLLLFYRSPQARKNHPVVAFAAPIGLLLVFALASSLFATELARWLVLFFAFLFWHYTKQSYGIFVLSFREHAAFRDPRSLERQFLLAGFLWLGIFGFLSTQIGKESSLLFGFYVPTLGLPLPIVAWIGRAGALVALGYGALICGRYQRWEPFLTLLATYLWADQALTNFRLLPLLPAFHAAQYFPLVSHRLFERSRPARWSAGILWAVLAMCLFILFRPGLFASAAALTILGALELVLNLHHYFVDSYLWRARDPAVRAELGADGES